MSWREFGLLFVPLEQFVQCLDDFALDSYRFHHGKMSWCLILDRRSHIIRDCGFIRIPAHSKNSVDHSERVLNMG